MLPVLLLVPLLGLRLSSAQPQPQTFHPGCSFYNGQCVYTVQLGHAGQCDARRATDGNAAGCCTALQGELTSLRGDVTRLDAMMAEIARTLNDTTSNLDNATSTLATVQQERDHLEAQLRQKEADLNSTQVELARILHQAGEEIQKLRHELAGARTDLYNCQSLLGVKTGATTLPPGQDANYTLTFCDFETTSICGYSQDKDDHSDMLRYSGSTGNSGPEEDHTFGSPKGHYMYMLSPNAYSSRPTLKITRLTSPSYPPAMEYCVRFWFHMHGNSVKDLKVYAKINGGRGYPVWSRSGDQGPGWQLGEVQLDSEYTANNFSLTFEATSGAYKTYVYSSRYKYTNVDSIIALDDVYVYNTSCSNIPVCPANAHMRQGVNSSSCYSFHVSPKSWTQAAVACRQLGADSHLVSVTSQDEQDFLVSLIKADPTLTSAGQYGWYTGATDERHEGTFEWTDGGSPHPLNYTDWHLGQPNNVASNQDCLLLQYAQDAFDWGDVDCAEQHPYICEVNYPTSAP